MVMVQVTSSEQPAAFEGAASIALNGKETGAWSKKLQVSEGAVCVS